MDLKTFRLRVKNIKQRTLELLPELLSTGIQNLERNYLELENLSLKEILAKLNFLNNLFNYSFFYQYESERLRIERNKIIDTSQVLIEGLRNDLRQSYTFFKSSNTDSAILFNDLNTVFFNHSRYVKDLYLDIPGYHFKINEDIYFELFIETESDTDHSIEEYEQVLINKTIPYRFVGNYIEKINFDEQDYNSLYEHNGSEIKILDADHTENTSMEYSLNESGHIVFDITQTIDDTKYIQYVPKTHSIAIPVNRSVKSIYLKTNLTDKSIKKYAVIIGDDNV